MNSLTTYCQTVADRPGEFNIYWRNGHQGAGLITVSVHPNLADPDVIAELSALQWLLCQRSVFGITQNGKGLHLKICAGAIRKAVRAESAGEGGQFGKPHLKPYAQFLTSRFAGAILEVSKEQSWIPPGFPADHAWLSVNKPLPNLVDIPGLGLVAVTKHAFDRFSERLCKLEQHDAWRLLCRAVRGPLRQLHHAPRADLVESDGHGRNGEVWVNPANGWGFVLVTRAPQPVMVTAYSVHDRQRIFR